MQKNSHFEDGGFFNHEEINIHGKKIKPIDITTEILKKDWFLKKMT